MRLAKDFLSKFHNLTPPNDAVRRAVAKTVRAIAGIDVTTEQVSVTRGVAFIACSSVAKSALRSQRIDILSELYREMPKARDSVRDIR